MLTLEDVKKFTTQVFEDDNGLKEMVIPEPSVLWKDKLEALKQGNLVRQRESAIFEMRCWQAEQMGFQKLELSEMVQMLMGEAHTKDFDGPNRQNHEWAYDHHNDCLLGKDWGAKPTIFQNWRRKNAWYLPPFTNQLIWECQFGQLDYLKCEIPHGVVLRINECKALKLFNAFYVIAPQEAWTRKSDIDPIVVASIWELPTHPEHNTNRNAGQRAYFFIAQW